ncbi:unnamed protein product [Vitrella brassicaformis CCMP3155]|uniref:Uncharacterized protein n=1 Tax=Vitrella brassicaformis (strain CCMP3155) TaxID=1169540 RepID=A0A0G4EUP6_VITBC|nr:unnamed protein product [Vitrella brassicaformis CCMP3155]|mmetsp:Transcript_29683/g.85971  ORF Transcript_29683/g.85971 Transcript_29683/m.85971 type:complete len:138 (+) Transcript_29683:401-814(+)|eukprot:CEM02309.1 unnamed protein product [Vitrella brassicaformis CCMP3155]
MTDSLNYPAPGSLVRIKLENVRYFRFHDDTVTFTMYPSTLIDEGKFKTVGDVRRFLNIGRRGLLLAGYDDVDDSTLIGDKGKTEADPFLLREAEGGVHLVEEPESGEQNGHNAPQALPHMRYRDKQPYCRIPDGDAK